MRQVVLALGLGFTFGFFFTFRVRFFRGVGNDLKFRRSPLKSFLKDDILPEICAVLKLKFDNRKDVTKINRILRSL